MQCWKLKPKDVGLRLWQQQAAAALKIIGNYRTRGSIRKNDGCQIWLGAAATAAAAAAAAADSGKCAISTCAHTHTHTRTAVLERF